MNCILKPKRKNDNNVSVESHVDLVLPSNAMSYPLKTVLIERNAAFLHRLSHKSATEISVKGLRRRALRLFVVQQWDPVGPRAPPSCRPWSLRECDRR